MSEPHRYWWGFCLATGLVGLYFINRTMQLREILKQPGKKLEKFGLIEIWEDTSDTVRWAWFRKHLFAIDDVNYIIELTFSLSIDDDPFVTYDDNLFFSFDHCKIIVTKGELNYVGRLSDNKRHDVKEEFLKISSTTELKSFMLSANKFQSFI